MRNVLVFTSGRSDYGILRPLLREINRSPDLTFELFVTGSHLDDRHGHTIDEIIADGFPVGHAAPILQESDDWKATTTAMARAIEASADAIEATSPTVGLVLGDRFEALAFAIACHVARLPLAHLHGGEVTSGSADDANRHAITKFATTHLVAAEDFARRVRQLGEAPERVHVVGALGLDAILEHREDLSKVDRDRQSLLVTYHPSTTGDEDPVECIDAVLNACLGSDLPRIVVTSPNADHGGEQIRERIGWFSSRHPDRLRVVTALGALGFHREVVRAAAVVGNSSAGIIEVPFLGTPTVNIGSRQDGRPRADGVIDVATTADAIAHGIDRARHDQTHREPFATTVYGDGHAAGRIIPVLIDMPLDGPSPFRDLETV